MVDPAPAALLVHGEAELARPLDDERQPPLGEFLRLEHRKAPLLLEAVNPLVHAAGDAPTVPDPRLHQPPCPSRCLERRASRYKGREHDRRFRVQEQLESAQVVVDHDKHPARGRPRLEDWVPSPCAGIPAVLCDLVGRVRPGRWFMVVLGQDRVRATR